MNKQEYKELHRAIREDMRRFGRWSNWTIEFWRELPDDWRAVVRYALDGPVHPSCGLQRPYEYAESRRLTRHQTSDLLAIERRYRRV